MNIKLPVSLAILVIASYLALMACGGGNTATALVTHGEPLPTHWGIWDYIQVDLVVQDGCLRSGRISGPFARPDSSYLLIWPEGFTLKSVDGSSSISDQNGEIVARVGDTVRLSGRFVAPDSDLGAEIAGSVPEECTGPYYIIGDDVSVVGEDESELVSAKNSGLFLLRQTPLQKTAQAEDTLDEFIGPFELSLDGNCLLIVIDGSPYERHALQWPPGFYPHIGEDGMVEIRNGGDRTIARVGDRLLIRTKERELKGMQSSRNLRECDAWLWQVKEIRNVDLPVVFEQFDDNHPGYDYIRGSLEIYNGCICIGRNILIFPPDFTMREQDGISILDERGVAIAREAEHTHLQGRRVSQDSHLGRQIRRTLPLDCPHGDFWLVN